MSKYGDHKFTCSRCFKELENDRPDAEIDAELEAQGIKSVEEEGVQLLCSDCFYADPDLAPVIEKTQEILARGPLH